jgi:hypothetical protein
MSNISISSRRTYSRCGQMSEESSISGFESYTPGTKLVRPSPYTARVLCEQAATDWHFEDTYLLKSGESVPVEFLKMVPVHNVRLLFCRDHESNAFQTLVSLSVQQTPLVPQHCNVNDEGDEGG